MAKEKYYNGVFYMFDSWLYDNHEQLTNLEKIKCIEKWIDKAMDKNLQYIAIADLEPEIEQYFRDQGYTTDFAEEMGGSEVTIISFQKSLVCPDIFLSK